MSHFHMKRLEGQSPAKNTDKSNADTAYCTVHGSAWLSTKRQRDVGWSCRHHPLHLAKEMMDACV